MMDNWNLEYLLVVYSTAMGPINDFVGSLLAKFFLLVGLILGRFISMLYGLKLNQETFTGAASTPGFDR